MTVMHLRHGEFPDICIWPMSAITTGRRTAILQLHEFSFWILRYRLSLEHWPSTCPMSETTEFSKTTKQEYLTVQDFTRTAILAFECGHTEAGVRQEIAALPDLPTSLDASQVCSSRAYIPLVPMHICPTTCRNPVNHWLTSPTFCVGPFR